MWTNKTTSAMMATLILSSQAFFAKAGFCSWTVCEGGAPVSEWCDANQSRCEQDCSGKWCTSSNGSPSPPSGPPPSPPSGPPPSPPTGPALYRENFELSTSWYTFNGDARTQAYTEGGIDGRILRTSYPPTDRGSERLVKRFDLQNTVSEATLSFDMKLHSKFEFVRGGKMHGLGGGTGTTGGKGIDPKGWSVRMMWRAEGVPELYIYHQDRECDGKDECYGERYRATGFKFSRQVWYRIDIQVKMNSAVGSGDGHARLYIDGILQAEANDLNLSGDDSVQIDQFHFSTFYGGSNKEWAPTQTTYCYFDNFSVMPGLSMTGTQGTQCEIYEQGIYSASNEICCADSCGSCGGTGCGDRDGGASSCCTSKILDNGPMCSSSSSAPCKF